MADPLPYTVSYSFTGFQNNAPNTPLPAPALDNELLDVATSIATIVGAVKDVRRPDGALNNGIVTFDSLTLALQLMFTSTNPTNANLVAGAVAAAQAAAASATGGSTSAAASAASALANANAAAASASSVNLTLFLAKANNLAGLGSQATSRQNLGLGSVATFNVGSSALNIPQLDGGARLPSVDGSQLTNVDVLPVGALVFAFSTTPFPGTVKLNGSLLSRASFPRLWAYASASGDLTDEAHWSANTAAFSNGDLTTSFRLPDLRGEFIRSFDDGRGVDAGRGMGGVQLDLLKDHTHLINGGVAFTAGTTSVGNGPSNLGAAGGPVISVAAVTSSPSTGAAAETRPRNIPLLACIKY